MAPELGILSHERSDLDQELLDTGVEHSIDPSSPASVSEANTYSNTHTLRSACSVVDISS
jgi:hypothetical protein